jgi:hypothetical protein
VTHMKLVVMQGPLWSRQDALIIPGYPPPSLSSTAPCQSKHSNASTRPRRQCHCHWEYTQGTLASDEMLVQGSALL